jgi:hypothetical protein
MTGVILITHCKPAHEIEQPNSPPKAETPKAQGPNTLSSTRKTPNDDRDNDDVNDESDSEELSDIEGEEDVVEKPKDNSVEFGEALGGAVGSIIGAISSTTASFGGGGYGSSVPSGGPVSTPTPAAGSSFDTLRRACVDSINAYRASVGAPPVTLRDASSSCTDQQSARDGASGRAHGSFGSCGESAQNECPGWGGDPGGSQQGCLKMMWAEGPGGGHYENMKNPRYRQVACGYANTGGGYWMIQNFY